MKNESKELVVSREKVKKNKPDFRRHESWRYERLKQNWRRPRGLDNKMRQRVKGWPASPNVGYRGPRKSRSLHPSGFKEVRVFNPDNLTNVDPKFEAVRISGRVGNRKRLEIVNRARERGIHVLNPGAFKEAEISGAEEEATKEKKE